MTDRPQLSDPVKDVAGSPRPNVQPGSRFASTTDTAGPFECRSPGCSSGAMPKTIWCAEHRYPDVPEDGYCLYTGCFNAALDPSPWCYTHTTRVEKDEEIAYLREIVKRAAFVAEHLFAMIDPQTWRDHGGDDGQGHYEGDYRAEQTALEIERWKESVA